MLVLLDLVELIQRLHLPVPLLKTTIVVRHFIVMLVLLFLSTSEAIVVVQLCAGRVLLLIHLLPLLKNATHLVCLLGDLDHDL